MTLPPASLPAAATVPISPPSSAPYRAGAAAGQASDSPSANKPNANGFVRSKENPAKAAAPDQGESTDGNSGESTIEQAFSDIIRQLSSEASAPTPQSAASNANPGLFRGWQVGKSVQPTTAQPIPATVPTAAQPAPLPVVQAPEGKQPRGTARLADTPLTPGKDHTQDLRALPMDVVVPFVPVRPKLPEIIGGGGVSEADLKPRAVHAAPLQPEAALTVVIRNNDQTSPPAAAPAKPAEAAADQTEPVTSDATAPVTKPATPAASASDTPESTVSAMNTAQAANYEIASAAGAPSSGSDTEHRKAGGGAASNTADVGAVKTAGTQTTAFQDLQLKAEPAKNDNSGPRAATQAAPAAPAERAMPEKSASPVKSVSLEFTPDGTRDVKVRLSERGGEVHVSVHSTDPNVTKNLRAGVTDLASVLEHAGYDAKAWTGDRPQQGNPQQQEQQSQQRRQSKSGDGAQQFESILQQPNQENS